MDPICLFFTLCGAATLAGSVVKVVDKLEK